MIVSTLFLLRSNLTRFVACCFIVSWTGPVAQMVTRLTVTFDCHTKTLHFYIAV